MDAPVKKRIHIISRGGGKWAVKRSDKLRAGRVFSCLGYALDNAKKYLSQGWYVLVHKTDGTVDYFMQPDRKGR